MRHIGDKASSYIIMIPQTSTSSKSSTHCLNRLNDTIRFDVSSKGHSSESLLKKVEVYDGKELSFYGDRYASGHDARAHKYVIQCIWGYVVKASI
jgi:hypothetical protein